MRKEIQEFAEEMERIMAKHDAKKGDSWKSPDTFTQRFLIEKFYEETKEAMQNRADKSEYVDVANICMMLWYRQKEGVVWK